MAEIINFNKFRKLRERQREKASAAENRVRHGRPRVETKRDAAERGRRREELDSKHLDHEPAPKEPPVKT